MNTDTRLIPLTQGKFAIVDSIDYDWLMQWKWYAVRHRRKECDDVWYACRNTVIDDRRRPIAMHQEISIRMQSPSEYLDHKDHDGLNNSRSNIRPCNSFQNIWNTSKRGNRSSRFKGVSLDKKRKKWGAIIFCHGEQFHLGRFKSEWQAHLAYVEASEIVFGEFACCT